MKINRICPDETVFTEVLTSIALMPKTLYYYGDWAKMVDEGGKRARSVAIVGARKNIEYGRKVAYDLAYELAKRGVVIVSGLAYGVDSIAHRAALDAGGRTVVILGTTIDRIYPTRHIGLAREIVEKGGVVMSEYGVGEEIFLKTSFLARNRLIAGLAEIVIIVEAADRSGTLNTAMHALDQGKELFAVPGDVGKINSVGCNRLIQKGTAVYTGVDDVLLVMRMKVGLSKKKRKARVDKIEEAVLKMIEAGEYDGEKIMEKIGIDSTEFGRTITILKLEGGR